MRISVLATLVAVCLALVSAPPASAQEGAPKLEVSRGKEWKGVETVVVPTVLVNLAVDGSAFVANQKDFNSVQAKGKFVVGGMDKELAQGIAKQIYDDAVAKLRAAGIKVLTYEDIKDDPSVVEIKRREPHEDWGLPYLNDRNSRINYVIATPSDAQAFKAGLTGITRPFWKLAQARGATVFIPEYWIDAPQMWTEKEGGYKRISAEVNIAPGMTLRGGFLWTLTHKGGWMPMKQENWVNVAENVGQLGEADKGGWDMGLVKRTKANWFLKIDRETYRAGAVRAGGLFNAAVIESMLAERAKP